MYFFMNLLLGLYSILTQFACYPLDCSIRFLELWVWVDPLCRLCPLDPKKNRVLETKF